LALLASPSLANADDFSFKLEPGVSASLAAPQSQIYGTGGGQSLKALFGLTPYLDVGPSASFLFLPASTEGAEAGVVWGLGAGMRLKRPHDRESYYGVSPWFDADLLYMRTGGLNRPGFDAAVGLAVPIGESRNFWVGPFARYLHTGESERTGYDSRDAKVLIVGVSLEVGSGIQRKRIAPEIRETRPVEPIAAAIPCEDRDNDGIADNVDRCPDVAGLMEGGGCPNYDKLVVKKDKLELKEKLYFAWDKAKIEDASFPVLDEVVKALKDNLGFRVQVEGHADSSGADDHNQTLSEHRAEAVLAYLAAHDVAQDRLVSKGFSSSVPTDTNDTVAGRENNRRVEFVVSFIILNDGSVQ
jgi:outer membrane protein OmpA-like peptidoglycan-associated protein